MALDVVSRQFKTFMDSKYTLIYDYDSQMTEKCFLDHTGQTINAFRDELKLRLVCVKEFIEGRLKDSCSEGFVNGEVNEEAQEISSEENGNKTDKVLDIESLTSESCVSDKVTQDSIRSDHPDIIQCSDTEINLKNVSDLCPEVPGIIHQSHDNCANPHVDSSLIVNYDTKLLEKETDSTKG